MTDPAPILYSFRRCPYAMRARLVLAASQTRCELREVILRDKPPELLAASPKATVPVLILPSGVILEESLDIMNWARTGNATELSSGLANHVLVQRNDGDFKHHLDRYKYPHRYEGADALEHRTQAESFISQLNEILSDSAYLDGDSVTDLDFAIAPFIRQFANTDRTWFDAAPYPYVQRWLGHILSSNLFLAIMKKYPKWTAGDETTFFHVNESTQ